MPAVVYCSAHRLAPGHAVLEGQALINALVGAVCTLSGRAINALRDPQAEQLTLALMQEVIQVGRAEGAKFADDAAHRALKRIMESSAEHFPSITQDRLAGQATEWVIRNQVIVRLAAKHGIAVPLNAEITALLRLGEPSGAL